MSAANGKLQHGAIVRRIPGFDVSWAGTCTLNNGFFFGSEDGRFAIMGVSTTQLISQSFSTEAINGLAFSKRLIAISTRNEITFIPPPSDAKTELVSVIPAGSHGVISTSSGKFVSPSGLAGLMVVEPFPGKETIAAFCQGEGKRFNFYKAVPLPLKGRDVVACAARLGGLIGTDFSGKPGTRTIYSQRQHELDVVDVCALDDGLSAAALGRDGTIVLSTNILSAQRPITLKFPSIEGVAYRLLSGRGHLFLLTSKALYVLNGLASRFLAGKEVLHKATTGRKWPMEAVDVNLVDNRWLLIVLSNGVLQVDLAISDLIKQPQQTKTEDDFEDSFSPESDWESSESLSEETQFALA